MKLTDRDKRVVAAGLLLALGIVGWTYVVSPMQSRWKRATEGLRSSEGDLEKLRRLAGESRRYRSEREGLADLVLVTPDLEASQSVVPVLINQIESFGQRRRIQVTRYEPLPPKVEESYAVYSLNLSFRSDLPELVSFLQDIRSSRPVINVVRMHVTPPGPDAKVQELSVEMLLSAFAVKGA